MALLIVEPTVRIVRSGVYAHVHTACRIQILLTVSILYQRMGCLLHRSEETHPKGAEFRRTRRVWPQPKRSRDSCA